MSRSAVRALVRAGTATLVMAVVRGPAAEGQSAIRDSVPAGSWIHPAGDLAMTRWSPIATIDTANVAGLHPVWSFETGARGPHEGNPLVVGGRMYVHTPFPNAVHALDLARPGAPPVWSWSAPEDASRLPGPEGCCDVGSRGLAWHPSGKLFVPLLPGQLAALDATTGREVWRVRNVDPRAGGWMAGAPLVAGGLVIVGSGGAALGARGHLTAYDAANGRLVWRAHHTGPDTAVGILGDANSRYASHRGRDLGMSTWPPNAWQRGGATASGWLAYDAALDLVFYGTDAPAPPNAARRPGENKWGSTIFARVASTGRVRWALQLTPHDEWGYGAANESILVDLTIGGRAVKGLVHFDANGFAYTIDRTSGALLLVERLGPANWALRMDRSSATPVRDPRYAMAGRVRGICPSAVGMKGLGPAAYSPVASRFFVPLNNLCMNVRPGRDSASPSVMELTAGPGDNRGRFISWDAATGAIGWEIREELPLAGGALATAGGLIFYGTVDGWLKAVDQAHGRELWRFRTPGGIVGSPMTFLGPDGRQYVAVLSGGTGRLGGAGEAAGSAPPEAAPGVLTVLGL